MKLMNRVIGFESDCTLDTSAYMSLNAIQEAYI